MGLSTLIRRMQVNLTVDLLKPALRKRAKGEHPTFGYCYVVSEALYHLYGKDHGFTPRRVRIPAFGNWYHYWLENEKGKRLDATVGQFIYRGFMPPYEQGKGCAFMTKVPSARAQELIRRVKAMR